MLHIGWNEHRTDGAPLDAYSRLLCTAISPYLATQSELVKCTIQGKVQGKRRRGRPMTPYSGNIAKWVGGNLEPITRDSRDPARYGKEKDTTSDLAVTNTSKASQTFVT